ncbi:hypothetical protein GGS20DRAFT_354208 [Poronia punctata]|nr:hypothetical protein GGS20DRAFT_354208 [Poronia punctata]
MHLGRASSPGPVPDRASFTNTRRLLFGERPSGQEGLQNAAQNQPLGISPPRAPTHPIVDERPPRPPSPMASQAAARTIDSNEHYPVHPSILYAPFPQATSDANNRLMTNDGPGYLAAETSASSGFESSRGDNDELLPNASMHQAAEACPSDTSRPISSPERPPNLVRKRSAPESASSDADEYLPEGKRRREDESRPSGKSLINMSSGQPSRLPPWRRDCQQRMEAAARRPPQSPPPVFPQQITHDDMIQPSRQQQQPLPHDPQGFSTSQGQRPIVVDETSRNRTGPVIERYRHPYREQVARVITGYPPPWWNHPPAYHPPGYQQPLDPYAPPRFVVPPRDYYYNNNHTWHSQGSYEASPAYQQPRNPFGPPRSVVPPQENYYYNNNHTWHSQGSYGAPPAYQQPLNPFGPPRTSLYSQGRFDRQWLQPPPPPPPPLPLEPQPPAPPPPPPPRPQP